MKQSSRTTKPQPKLSDTTQQNLKMYALAASAAGVGMLALAPPSEAKIIYTPAHIPIVVDGAVVELDLNHDGTNDFQLYNGYQGPMGKRPEGNHASNLTATPEQASNRVLVAESKGHLCAVALHKGQRIGPRGRFQPGKSSMIMAFASGDSTGGTAFGPWLKVKQGYLGLKFVIKGKVHFGWARIKMNGLGNEDFVTGYAYETVPNKAIVAGATTETAEADTKEGKRSADPNFTHASLGLLAMGSPSLSVWRRKE